MRESCSQALEVLRQPLSAQDWRGILTAGLLPFNANRLNPPLWSLIIEQHVALLMPLLLWVTRQGGAVTAVFLGACVMFSGHWYALWFVPAFTLGVLIRHLRVPSPWAWMVLLLALGLWQHRLITGDDPLYRFTASLGAAALLVALRSLPPQSAPVTVLCTPWSQWLGQVSFSLYVTHFAVLMLGAMLTPHVPWVGAALAVPLSFLLAALVHHLIERPLVTSRSGPAPVRQ